MKIQQFLIESQARFITNLIEKCSWVNSYLLSHVPVWMFQSISNSNFFQFINGPIPIINKVKNGRSEKKLKIKNSSSVKCWYFLLWFCSLIWISTAHISAFSMIWNLNAPPEAVKIIRLRAPSGKPWIHWRKGIPLRYHSSQQ